MLAFVSVFAFAALSTLADIAIASPLAYGSGSLSLQFAKHINVTGAHRLAALDRARARALYGRSNPKRSENEAAAANIPVANAGTAYVATIGIGSPPTEYNLLVDTGSANTWIGANKHYVQTSTSVQTNNSVGVTYGSGSFDGIEYTDRVTLGNELIINGQGVGVASHATDLSGLDGILGIGPAGLTEGTLSPDMTSQIPTVTDNLLHQGIIKNAVVSAYFEPTKTVGDNNGELTWGDIDRSKYTGEITYLPITQISPASAFWGVDASISYGRTSLLSATAGIFDTGTTLILLATDAFQAYQQATSSVMDSDTGLLRITLSQFSSLKDLILTSNDSDFKLVPDAQIWPRALNTAIGGKVDAVYLIVADLGTPKGQGLDFVNGKAFHERFYSVYDTTNARIGLAKTYFTDHRFN